MTAANAIPLPMKKPRVVEEPDHLANFIRDRDPLFERFARRAEEVYQGRNRRTFLIRGYAVKIPLNFNGAADNDWEGSVRNGDRPLREYDIVYPKTRLVYFSGIPVLFMERVLPATSNDIRKVLGRVPKWTDRVDGGQVGFTKDGRLVAYGYGPR